MSKITNLNAEPLYRISDSREAIDFFFPVVRPRLFLLPWFSDHALGPGGNMTPFPLIYDIVSSITKENKELFSLSLSLSLSLHNQRSCFKWSFVTNKTEETITVSGFD